MRRPRTPGHHAGRQGLHVTDTEPQFHADASAGFSARAMPRARRPLPFSESDILSELGARVRATRRSRDMSRRELAKRSGISERYIAQIEAGQGNVSIVLLLRIAHAVRCE